MQEKYMKMAIELAGKALKEDEVPIGSVIVKNNKIISKAYNTKEKKYDVTCHAEINAIKKACKKLKTWHLDECELYTTLEPCMMCTGAIIQSRIKKVYFSAPNINYGYLKKVCDNSNHSLETEEGLYKEESIYLLKKFFKSKRN